jgi:hypothetical protein
MVLVDSPWVKDPFPCSVAQPNAYRVVKWLRRPTQNLPPNYPYRDHPDRKNMIPYHEWRGQGRPPNDIGYPGDVCINMTPGNLKYSLYGHTSKGWDCFTRNSRWCPTPISMIDICSAARPISNGTRLMPSMECEDSGITRFPHRKSSRPYRHRREPMRICIIVAVLRKERGWKKI